jgi:hypothetical protein
VPREIYAGKRALIMGKIPATGRIQWGFSEYNPPKSNGGGV